MRTKNIILLLVIGALSFYSCSDDYLETRPTEFTNEAALNDVAEFDPSVFDGVLAGVYVNLSTPGTGGTTGHDDLGHKGYDIFTDMMSSDMVLAGLNYGWYRGVSDYSWIQNPANNRNYMPWRFYYRIIRGANAVIDANGGTEAVPETEAGKYIMGQAKALRAFGYFYLTQLFQTDYDPSEELLPIYREASLVNTPLSTVGEVFELIESDLTTAVDYLETFDREYKFQINKYIAEGLLAYAYAAQGKYDEAYPLAVDIVDNGGFSLVTGDEVTGGFNDVDTPGWMWGINITADMQLNLVGWWGQMDPFTYSYAWAGDPKSIDEGLFNSMDASDVRREQFGNPSYGPYVPTQKFYNPDRTIGGTSSDYNEMDYLYMRVAEFHLLAAEAAVKKSNPDFGAAQMHLMNLMNERVDDASYISGLTGQALLDEISLQTRLELWGEGKSYLLMKRNDENRTRGSNHILFPGETIAHDEERVSFLIPTLERQNNPFID